MTTADQWLREQPELVAGLVLKEMLTHPVTTGEIMAAIQGTLTAADLLTAIHEALKAQDMQAVAAFLPRLAVLDPDGAQAILDALELAVAAQR